MPRYIDQHTMKPFTAEQLKQLQDSEVDEFGVIHHELIFSEEENKIWCIIDAPSKEAVEKHHAKTNVKADFIVEVETTR